VALAVDEVEDVVIAEALEAALDVVVEADLSDIYISF